jgi:hypothetical protein
MPSCVKIMPLRTSNEPGTRPSGDLFRIDSDIAITKASTVYDDGHADTPDAVSTLLKSEVNERFRIRENVPVEPRPERLFSFDPPSTEGFVEERIGKILGIADIAEEMALRK